MTAIFFTAPYCGACNAMRSAVIDPMRNDGFEIDEVDCMADPFTAELYKVIRVPTVIVLDDGEEASRRVGFVPREVMELDMNVRA